MPTTTGTSPTKPRRSNTRRGFSPHSIGIHNAALIGIFNAGQQCVAAVADHLGIATAPAVLVDLDADRFHVAADIMTLAEKLRMPVAVSSTAKAVIDETFPGYVGVYNGQASAPATRAAIENSDCLLAIGYRPIEVTTGDFTAVLPADTIHARGYSVDVGPDNYQAVTLQDVLRGVLNAVPQITNRPPAPAATVEPTTDSDAGQLTQAVYWQAIQNYLQPGDVLLADNGTSYAVFGLHLPPGCTFVGSVNWGSVGALLGTLTAAPRRRHLLFVGDGSFQLTAQELSTILRHDHKPVIFLINNGGYTIERGYLGKTEPYNDIANWAYADLPQVLRPGTTARSFVVNTTGDLADALSAPNDTLIFIESVMDPHEAPAPVIRSSNNGAEIDYGPHGPHHRDNAQLRPE